MMDGIYRKAKNHIFVMTDYGNKERICHIVIFLAIVGYFLYTFNMKSKVIDGHSAPLIDSLTVVELNCMKKEVYYGFCREN